MKTFLNILYGAAAIYLVFFFAWVMLVMACAQNSNDSCMDNTMSRVVFTIYPIEYFLK